MNRFLLASILALLSCPDEAAAGEQRAGTSSGEFLKLGADARGVAMGGEMSAASEDASAAYWNPAGLARLKERHAAFTHSAMFESVFYDFASYAQPIQPLIPTRRREMRPSVRGTLAVAALYLNAGSIEQVDKTGKTQGSFIARDAAVIAAWGASVSYNLDIGLALKYVDSRITAQARTGTLDLGARYNTELYGWPYVIALNARNLGGNLRFRDQADPLPTTWRVGQYLKPWENWMFTLDMVLPRDNDPYPAFGTEVKMPVENYDVFLRGGWSGRTSAEELDGFSSISVGFGLGMQGVAFDYAWLPFGALGMTHRLSLDYKF